jgi:hypothetical protein
MPGSVASGTSYIIHCPLNVTRLLVVHLDALAPTYNSETKAQ